MITDGPADPAKTVEFRSEDHIELNEGFQYLANNGGSFLAHIKDCPDLNDNILTRGTGTYGLSLPSTSNTIYDYDQNGNTKYDLSRDLNIKYNYLNKPYEVSRGTDKIQWLYAADGTKLQKKVSVSGSSDLKNYYGEIERSGSEYSVYHSDGRYYESGDGASWQYKVSDHLGNTRVLYSDDNGDNQLEVLQSNHYYPFGMPMAGEWDHHGSTNNAYLYNDKEMNKDLGYDMVDYGARFYEPVITRWTSVDPLASEFPSWTPYHYVHNNPLRYTDPTGMSADDIILRGSNNSSITIKTDLVDIDVDAGSIVGDLGGNYTFEGDDILVAGLDIAGVVDPIGVADVAAASLEAKNGNYGIAALSALGVIPYVGDLGKVGKIGKHTKTIKKVISETKAGKGNITSKSVLTESQALDAGIDFVGGNARELGKNGSGVFRSQTKNADGTVNQFRMDNGSIQGNHNPNVPHVHLEVVKPNNKVRVNNHIPIKKN